jgi:hypothetical protein
MEFTFFIGKVDIMSFYGPLLAKFRLILMRWKLTLSALIARTNIFAPLKSMDYYKMNALVSLTFIF